MSCRQERGWICLKSTSPMIVTRPSTPMCRRARPAIAPARAKAHPSRRPTARSADMGGWWQRYPREYAAELASLNALGTTWSRDEQAFQQGRLIIDIAYPLGPGDTVRLRATYPDTYPYFMPTVELPALFFRRHQNPTGRNLCLLGRDGEDWRPGHDTLGQLIREQLPKIQAINGPSLTPEAVAAQEDHAGEPLSNALRNHPECQLIVPDALPDPAVRAGRLKLRVRDHVGPANEMPFLGGMVKTICDLAGVPLVEFPVTIPAFVKEVAGFWLRLDAPPDLSKEAGMAEEVFFRRMEAALPAFSQALQRAKPGQLLVAGFTYPDEISWRTQAQDWVFLAIRIRARAKRARPVTYDAAFVRADWGGEAAWLRRAPFLQPLRTRSALLVGLGSLGSPVALQLAKSGLRQLDLVDWDQLQVGNSVRWALGWRYAGYQKGTALADFIRCNYPYTQVKSHALRLGLVQQEVSEHARISELVARADLVIDATASHRVSHFLSDLCRELGKDYLWLTTTPGCSGGIVGRIQAHQTLGCWSCFQHQLGDGTIQLPADWGAREIQPGGCSQPTFIGAGIDSDEVALLAARLAVATLCRSSVDGYPDFDWDVAVGDLRAASTSLAPAWTTYALPRSDACGACRAP